MTDYRILLLTTAALFAATPAIAQDAAACDPATGAVCVITDAPLAGDIIVTATGVAQPAEQVGQAVTVITRDELDRRQTVVVSDLLATTPGVTVTRNGGIGTLTAVRIRGAEGDQTLTVIDGVRVNDPSSPGGAFDFGNLLGGSVERIEVLRGPNSVPWGSRAIGGVVNVITATATDGVQGRANAEYGYADTYNANASIAGRSGIFSGALTAGYLHTDGISAAANGSERDGFRQYGGSGRLGVEFAPGIGLDLRGYYANSRAEIDGFPAPFYSLADTAEFSKAQEIYGYAGAHANFADDRIRNRIAFTIADVNRDNYDPENVVGVSFFGRGRSERYEYQGDFQVVDQVRLVVGAEHENSRFTTDSDGNHTAVTSFYGEAIVTPVAPLTLTGGIRHDDDRDFGNHTTLSGNGVLALSSGTTLRASYAEGFKAPTLYQRFASFYGNINLRPETARNYDIGIQQALGGRARATVTYFNRHTKDQIGSNPVTFAYINIARTRADGVEAEIALNPVDALNFTANYSYINSEDRTPGANFGRDLVRRPRQTVSTSIDYRFPFGLSAGATISHVGDSFDNAANTARLDGYILAGLRASIGIDERFELYGRIDNLFDEQYQVVRGYGTYGRAAYGGVRVKLGK